MKRMKTVIAPRVMVAFQRSIELESHFRVEAKEENERDPGIAAEAR